MAVYFYTIDAFLYLVMHCDAIGKYFFYVSCFSFVSSSK